MFVIVWEFETEPRQQREFERAYGPAGAWVQLFRQGDGFLDTELLRDPDKAGRYVTIDRWDSREAFERFRETHRQAYEALDMQCERWTKGERLIGRFQT